MLVLVAYDITKPRRLAKIAQICEDYGTRVQYSIFECHIDDETFDVMWDRILEQIDDEEDRVVAYRLDAKNAKCTRTAGAMVCTEKCVCYLV